MLLLWFLLFPLSPPLPFVGLLLPSTSLLAPTACLILFLIVGLVLSFLLSSLSSIHSNGSSSSSLFSCCCSFLFSVQFSSLFDTSCLLPFHFSHVSSRHVVSLLRLIIECLPATRHRFHPSAPSAYFTLSGTALHPPPIRPETPSSRITSASSACNHDIT